MTTSLMGELMPAHAICRGVGAVDRSRVDKALAEKGCEFVD